MPAKKTRRLQIKSPPARPVRELPPPEQDGAAGRSGRGAHSALEQLIAQEKVRTRETGND